MAETILFCVGTNHKRASLDLREHLFIDEKGIESHIGQIRKEFDFSELMILSTCNRLELTGVVQTEQLEQQTLLKAFIRLQELAGRSEISKIDQLEDHLYFYRDDDACTHIFRVAGSLDSLVVGETQITGQFKDSMQLAQSTGNLGGTLARLSQEALSTAKKVRSQTEIGKKSVSIASAAAELISTVFTQIDKHRVLIIGAGEMARIVAQHLLRFNPKKFAIANRTEERALNLISELGGGEYIDLAHASTAIKDFDIIVTATNASEYVLTRKHFEAAMKHSRTKLCVDISLPRNVDPAAAELDELFSFDIDDLKKIVEDNKSARSEAANQAENIILQAAKRFRKWLDQQKLTPTLRKSHQFIEELVDIEIQRGLLAQKGWSEEQIKHIESTRKALIKSLAGNINGNIQRYAEQPGTHIDMTLLLKTFEKRKNDAKKN